jgi:stage II sporulation protein P
MNGEKLCLRIGALTIALAILLRLSSGSVLGTVVEALTSPEAVSVMLYLETGRVVRPTLPQISDNPADRDPTPVQPESMPTVPTEPFTQTVFSDEDADLVEVNSVCGYATDLPALLQKPLTWNLMQQEPAVLILHSHATESYTKTEDYKETSSYRTLNTDYNVVSIGAEIKKILEAGGIRVIHDTTLHDYPSYSSSYSHARTQIRTLLKENPSIVLVLDIHRDAVENSKGQQVAFTESSGGKKAARLMMVVGTDANGLNHPNWQENMALAVKLHAQLEKNTPGICRPISFRPQRFNQDLSTGGMLIEVGAAGNTRQEALEGARLLAQAILELSRGTK